MKKLLFILVLGASNFINAQKQHCCADFAAFKIYIYDIVEDSTNYWSLYPKPPRVTDNVLRGMEKEIIADNSAQYYLEHLSFSKFKSAHDYDAAFTYCNKMDYTYSILALAAHWNPDVRVYALQHLNKKLTGRPLINSVKMKNGEWKKEDRIATEFLLFLLENNPLFIPGSENSTIHEFYLSNILWNLDLLTGEHIVGASHFSPWYKSESHYKQALQQWKKHVVK